MFPQNTLVILNVFVCIFSSSKGLLLSIFFYSRDISPQYESNIIPHLEYLQTTVFIDQKAHVEVIWTISVFLVKQKYSSCQLRFISPCSKAICHMLTSAVSLVINIFLPWYMQEHTKSLSNESTLGSDPQNKEAIYEDIGFENSDRGYRTRLIKRVSGNTLGEFNTFHV